MVGDNGVALQNKENQMVKHILNIGSKLILLAAVFTLIATITTNKLQDLRTHKFNNTFATVAERERQLGCLAKNIYFEAGSEPFEGKVAVAQVTMNRVESGKYPADVCGVVYQKNAMLGKTVCQFSWFCERGPVVKPIHGVAYNESMEVAKRVLLENFRLSSVQGAMYYHADYVNPNWKKPKLVKIGHHIFYGEST